MKNVPHLRFKEFSGEWQIKKVGSICDSIVPGRNKPIMFDGDIPWVTTPDIEQSGSVFFSKKSLNITRAEAKKIGSKIVPKHSVIISCVGDLGLVAIAGVDLVINQQLHAFIASDTIYYKFLLYSLLMQKPYMEKVATKTAVPYMNKENCNSIPICHPEIIEQTKIADFLTAIDDRISQLAQKCDGLAQYKKGVMQKIFSQELRFKDEQGRAFPAWDSVDLGNLAFKVNTKNKDDSISKVLTNSAVQGIVSQNDFFDKDIANKNNLEGYYVVELNDFVYNPRISSSAPVGPIKRNKLAKGVMSPLYTVFRFKSGCLDFLEYFFETTYWHDHMKSVSNMGARFDRINITNEGFFSLPIALPSVAEQEKIAEFLSAVDEKISQAQAQLEAAKRYKQGLLQQMFV